MTQKPSDPEELEHDSPDAEKDGERELFAYQHGLEHPVIGMEAEFALAVDGVETAPESLWRHPSDFIATPLLYRATKASQLPTGGALYFDRGVLELVTPVIELAPRCTARMVRSVWEQIGFVREQLDQWQQRTGRNVRLKAFSSHFNVSYELPREERNKDRTIQKLALLLAYLLPVPVMLLGTNRRSTGVGVRPRRDRIEVTLDFTPDPGLMLATAALIVGIVRDVIAWPSYRLDILDALGLPYLAVDPGKHTTRKGWLVKDHHFAQSPFLSDIDAATWPASTGELMSLRELGWRTADFFRAAIRKVSDAFSHRLLFSVLEGRTPSMLQLSERPEAYEDVGRSIRWGAVLPELQNYAGEMNADPFAASKSYSEKRANDALERERTGEREFPSVRERKRPALIARSQPLRRAADLQQRLSPPWSGLSLDRRNASGAPSEERRAKDRRKRRSKPFDESTLDRSAYENVFIRLAKGDRLCIDGRIFKPSAMHGWYEADLENEATGEERRISIDKLAEHPELWVT